MSGEDRKRPVSASSANPTRHLAVDDIFGGDELQHQAADQVLCQSYKGLCDYFAEISDAVTNLELENLIEIVVSKLPGIRLPDRGVIARELENAPDIRAFVKECVRNKDYKGIRNLGIWFSSRC